MQTVKSTCRLCVNCGFEFDVEDNRIVAARPDRDYAVSHGYACTKGTSFIEFVQGRGVARLMHSLKRDRAGSTAAIDAEQAMDEIAVKLRHLIDRYGPRAVAFYTGTGSFGNTIAYGMARSLIHSIGTPNLFSTVTIDQPQKVITPARMGYFLGGKRSHQDVDVMLTVGNNPLVSHLGNPLTPAAGLDPGRADKACRARGVRHIVVDPRRSETARRADLHLQIIPGEDATLIAGIVRIILQNGWQNAAFCGRWVKNLDRLREYTAGFELELVAGRCGVRAQDVLEAARLFSHAQRPMAGCGTGTCMAPFSNLADFLIEALNALCGGYRQEGEVVRNRGLLLGWPAVADVLPPDRTWEHGPRCRSEPAGRIGGEFPTPLLPAEILHEGDDRIRALVVFSGNPAVAIVDPQMTRAALQSLELLVTLDHRSSETVAMSDYVIATSTFYERHELSGYLEMMFDKNFVDYSKPVVSKPDDVLDDWEFFWGIARRLGLQIEYKYMGLLMDYAALPPGLRLNMDKKPRQEEIIAWICQQRGLSFEQLAASPGGVTYNLEPIKVAATPGEGSGCRLDVCPDDVADELRELRASQYDSRYAYRLASRRLPHVMNSVLRGAPSLGDKGMVNYAYMNPQDMQREQLEDGSLVVIRSRYAEISAPAMSDSTVRSGVVSMAHCFDSPGGSHTGRLVPLAAGYRERISFMPHQSGVPIQVRRAPA
ncbi:MAG: molybdopterin-dependent oxidoreductase [Sinimarinibacterium sp.]|jgi:anaerobic selenocysteine-containing dehydrogenase